MDDARAREVVAQLRARDVMAHAERVGVYRTAVRVALGDGREALWDADDAPDLEAIIMRNGVLVGLVPTIAGGDTFDIEQTVAAIVDTDYDKPIGRGPGAASPSRPPTRSQPPPPPARGLRQRLRDLLG